MKYVTPENGPANQGDETPSEGSPTRTWTCLLCGATEEMPGDVPMGPGAAPEGWVPCICPPGEAICAGCAELLNAKTTKSEGGRG